MEAERVFKLAGIAIESKTPLGSAISIYRFKDKQSGELVDVRVVTDVWAGGADFTVNSLRLDVETGELLDRFNAVQDIQNKILKIPNDPEAAAQQAPFILFRAIKAVCQLDFVLDEEVKTSMRENVDKIDDSVEFVVKNDTDFVEWVLAQMFAGLKYNPKNYFALMEETGAIPIWVKSFSKRLGVQSDDSKTKEAPFQGSPDDSFEESISGFLSLISRRINPVSPEHVFEKIVELLKLRSPRKGDDFQMNVSKIEYR